MSKYLLSTYVKQKPVWLACAEATAGTKKSNLESHYILKHTEVDGL